MTGKIKFFQRRGGGREGSRGRCEGREGQGRRQAEEAIARMRFEVLQIALSALRANLLRSLLTMLGIVIGIAAVIAMIALGEGAQASVRERIAKLGTTLLQIDAQRVMQNGVQQNVTKRMTIDDVHAIEDRSPHVLAVQAQQDKPLQLVWGNRNTNITVNGVSSNFLQVRNFEKQADQ
jgi:putative ABC transport system permease protein